MICPWEGNYIDPLGLYGLIADNGGYDNFDYMCLITGKKDR